MVWLAVALIAALAPAERAPGAAGVLPRESFQDQEGRSLDLECLRGRLVVIVYGGREAVEDHVRWGRRLDMELQDLGVYRREDPESRRPVRILAVAQMGGVPSPFRPLLRAALRQHVERDFSLWLDWNDRMGALFGARGTQSSVVVADRAGDVHLIVDGPPEGARYRAVSALLRRLLQDPPAAAPEPSSPPDRCPG